jgi:hypothetical protein
MVPNGSRSFQIVSGSNAHTASEDFCVGKAAASAS